MAYPTMGSSHPVPNKMASTQNSVLVFDLTPQDNRSTGGHFQYDFINLHDHADIDT
ncbi:hypothetical protein WH297_17345 [Ochrobactrum vermis]|uniref:Uncharacterized protein n=1 Tax=Ochrobactrum vermis TaxID=1827297 RepID=A0ABU8PGV2_9HYPH|nr:hypothetical protein [Ochrobactrum vermis]